MINSSDLVEKFKQALFEGWGYIYGSAGDIWTEYRQANATREQTVKWGSKWIGKHVADCSGMFVWAFKQLGGTIYHGSNTMWKSYSKAKGELVNGNRADGAELLPGSAVYKYNDSSAYHHVGLYIGDGKVIEAKGTYYGVVQSKVSEWSHWAELTGVDYGAHEEQPALISGTCVVHSDNGRSVNLRMSNSKTAQKVTALPVGTQVSVVEDLGDWCRVKYTIEGFIMTQFLAIKKGDN